MEAHLYDSKASELISVRWSLCWVVIIVLGVPDASWIQSASSLEIAHLRLPFTVVKHVPSKTSHLTVNGEVNLASNRNDDSWKSSNWPKVRPAWTVKEVQEGRILIRGDVGAFGFVKPYTVPLICRLDSSAKSCSVFRPKTSGARNQGKGLQLLQGSSSRDWLSLRLQEYAEKADRQRKKVRGFSCAKARWCAAMPGQKLLKFVHPAGCAAAGVLSFTSSPEAPFAEF